MKIAFAFPYTSSYYLREIKTTCVSENIDSLKGFLSFININQSSNATPNVGLTEKQKDVAPFPYSKAKYFHSAKDHFSFPVRHLHRRAWLAGGVVHDSRGAAFRTSAGVHRATVAVRADTAGWLGGSSARCAGDPHHVGA